MNQATPAAYDLARQLLAYESRTGDQAEAAAASALRIFEKLRVHLSKLIGVAGFHALLQRALALAKAEVRWLEEVRSTTDGALQSFSEIVLKQDTDTAARGSIALLAQLLGLLHTFIGEALTLGVVQDVCPEAQLNSLNSDVEEKPE